ncbi:diaminopimelate epimerase [Acidisarcina polymorpha]|uniref:diaminopimelate epimerase n=1 Tax=Acidisarcina polymorpha TaxID=2211140 RepID=UPI000DEF3FA9|nr:diaminopimelate epimerase [Acidisarcina polymorpha]
MIQFVKAHACGNDFLIVEALAVEEVEHKATAVRLCARNTGVGADGVEYLKWTGPRSGRIRLFNADGSVAEISGNGTRCVAAWMAREAQAKVNEVFAIETDAGVRSCRVTGIDGNRYEMASDMGVPVVTERQVVLASGAVIHGAVVSMGNPHYVIFVRDDGFSIDGVGWASIGREICFHPDFPEQTNVEVVRTVSQGEIEIRIFERGVGPTTSSGTGTCAASAASIALRGLDSALSVTAPGGAQAVNWRGGSAEMTLTGPAELICIGEAF